MSHFRYFMPFFFVLAVFWNCAVFEPRWKTVPDPLVREDFMNEEQKNAIKATKQKIINSRAEINTLKKSNDVTAQSIKLSQAKVKKHFQDRDYFREKDILIKIQNENNTSKKYWDESMISDNERAKEENRLIGWTQKLKEDEALLRFKEASLAESMAEHELIRAEVAAKYQDSLGVEPGKENYVKKTDYDAQFVEKRSETRRRYAEWEKTKSEAVQTSKVTLEDTYLDEHK